MRTTATWLTLALFALAFIVAVILVINAEGTHIWTDNGPQFQLHSAP